MAGIRVLISKFNNRHWPEKLWIFTHPFMAIRVYKHSVNVLKLTEKIRNDADLDGDANGGQVDAFRHAYWMATLYRKFGAKHAFKIGRLHERGNKLDFKKHSLEDGAIPDRISSDMDLRNNELGVFIARKYKNASEKDLIKIVKQAILRGDLWIIKKDSKGNYLDWEGNMLEKNDYLGKWYNKRCLVPSDYKYS